MWYGIRPGTGIITRIGGAPGDLITGITITDTITTGIPTITAITGIPTITTTPVTRVITMAAADRIHLMWLPTSTAELIKPPIPVLKRAELVLTCILKPTPVTGVLQPVLPGIHR